MRTMQYCLLALCMLVGAANSAQARVNVDINLSLFPELVPVPGYPVYYAPQIDRNYFFYDGMYWLYEDDDWYVSHWYNGPWDYVEPDFVPLYVLRVPVRYYRRPPPYFREWRADAPPRWGHHWGGGWEHRHNGWDHWDRQRVPQPAPLPVYQREYSGDRYPRVDEQREIRAKDYRYQPRDSNVRQQYREPIERAREPVRQDNQIRQDNQMRQDNQRPDRERMPRQQPSAIQERAPMHQDAQMPQDKSMHQGKSMHQERDINSPKNGPAPAQGQGRGHDKNGDDKRGQGDGRDR